MKTLTPSSNIVLQCRGVQCQPGSSSLEQQVEVVVSVGFVDVSNRPEAQIKPVPTFEAKASSDFFFPFLWPDTLSDVMHSLINHRWTHKLSSIVVKFKWRPIGHGLIMCSGHLFVECCWQFPPETCQGLKVLCQRHASWDYSKSFLQGAMSQYIKSFLRCTKVLSN